MTENTNYIIPPEEEQSFDIRKWIGKILVNWYWFVISIAIFGGGAWIYTKYLVRTYKVEATMVVKANKQAVGAQALFNSMNLASGPSFPENEKMILKSWNMARRTLDQLDFDISYAAIGKWSENPLYQNVPFIVTLGPDYKAMYNIPIYIKTLSDSTFNIRINGRYNIDQEHSYHKVFEKDNIKFVLSPNPNFNLWAIPEVVRTHEYSFKVNNLDHLAYHYKNKVSAEYSDATNGSVLRLSSTGFSPQMECDYINKLMEEYIAKSLEEKNQIAKNTKDFIDRQLAGIVDTLREARENLTTFQAQYGATNLTANARMIQEELAGLRSEKRLIDIRVDYLKYLIETLEKDERLTELILPSSMGVSDEALSSLLTKLIEKSQEKANLEYSATENFPAVSRLNMEIASYRNDLKLIVNNMLTPAVETQNEKEREMSKLNYQISKLPENERKLLTMENRFEMTNEIYTFLSQKREEAAIQEASAVADQKIIDKARVDGVSKIYPNNYGNYTKGLAIGLLLPLLLIILKEVLNTKIREREDVEKRTKVPIIGSIGHNKKPDSLPVIKYGRSSIAESFRAIRTDLKFMLFKEDSKVIMITSTVSAEGKSFISMNLGGIFSVSGKKAVVVGLDLRKPVLHKELNIKNDKGVSTHIIGKDSLDEIIIESEHENLYFIPAGPVAPNPAELIETEEFKQFLENLKERFDVIILDTPPVAMVTDASLIANHSDAVIYVVRQNHTRKTSLNFIDKLSEKEHIKNLSIVINDVVVPRYYGYKYGYGYGYGYGKGYGSGYYIEK